MPEQRRGQGGAQAGGAGCAVKRNRKKSFGLFSARRGMLATHATHTCVAGTYERCKRKIIKLSVATRGGAGWQRHREWEWGQPKQRWVECSDRLTKLQPTRPLGG